MKAPQYAAHWRPSKRAFKHRPSDVARMWQDHFVSTYCDEEIVKRLLCEKTFNALQALHNEKPWHSQLVSSNSFPNHMLVANTHLCVKPALLMVYYRLKPHATVSHSLNCSLKQPYKDGWGGGVCSSGSEGHCCALVIQR